MHEHAFDACCRGGCGDGFVLPGAGKHYPPDLELEPVHLDVDLSVDLATATVEGTVTTTVVARRNGAARLALDAVAFRDVEISEPDGRAIRTSYDGARLEATWAEPFARGEERQLAVRYRVVRPATGIHFRRPTETEPDEPWFAATDHETERARFWLPCVDLPHVRPRYDFRLRAESRFTILAGGVLVAETDAGGGTKTAHWRLEVPCPSYIACFAIGEFVEVDDGEFEGRSVKYFAPPPFAPEDLRRSFGQTRAMLAWMTRKLDSPFPFPKYWQFAVQGIGGAMENISLVSWDDIYVMDEALASEWAFRIDQVNLHEMAHSWFGDAIVCRDFAHAWLKESWATYMQQVWLEEEVGREEFEYQYVAHADAYFEEADTKYRRPIVTREFHSSWQLYDRHLYPGGACRLHTLRRLLGDDAFWDGVREYVRRYSGGLVETDDFRRVLEERSGKSLGRFFDQWFRSPGYPDLFVRFEYDPTAGEGTFTIEQKRPSGDEGVPVFVFDLEVAWSRDGRQEVRTISIEREKEVAVFAIGAEPDQVRIDPGMKVLHKLTFDPGHGRLRRQLREAPDVRGRILAARELARTGTPENLEALGTALETEAFWGVRLEMTRALATSPTATAARLLARAVERERDPRVLETLMRSAGRFRDGEIRAAVEARVEAGLPPRALMAASEALGAQREDAPYDRLLRLARTRGRAGFAQSGALRGLAGTRRPEALDELIARTEPGATEPRARPAAVEALAHLGRTLAARPRERAVERLVDLLRDPSARVQQAAVKGLAAMKAREAVAAGAGLRGARSRQEQVDVEAAIHEIGKGDSPRVGALERELEELRSTVRRLEDRVRRVERREP